MSAFKELNRLGNQATFAQALAALKEIGAATLHIIARDDQERPLAAAIIVRGRKEATEILEAVNAIEERWDAGTPKQDPVAVLKRAEQFIAAFEDDEDQPGVTELLKDIRSITKGGAS